ncbi:MAG TPA: hypothetical protein VGS19_36355 [Streptosporangiaceae bacterium]|nr:hypothetical protein [Streptosporangiaceae bacterium]
MHLQERFVQDGLKALVVLTERVRARLAQGAGRATRNSADFAAVVMLGRGLLSFCGQPEVLAACHPELRAEVAFGLKDSGRVPASDAEEDLGHFLGQDGEWREAEGADAEPDSVWLFGSALWVGVGAKSECRAGGEVDVGGCPAGGRSPQLHRGLGWGSRCLGGCSRCWWRRRTGSMRRRRRCVTLGCIW